MAISDKVRRLVMERDEGRCQFFCGGRPATDVAHRDHQGSGGLPADHWKNQPPNLAAACAECHSKHQTELQWLEFEEATYLEEGGTDPKTFIPAGKTKFLHSPGKMIIEDFEGNRIPESQLFFYQRHILAAAKQAKESLHTIGTIDHIVGKMMHDLREGAPMLEEGGEFDQLVSSLGWDPVKAGEIADTFEWASEHGGWPEDAAYSKVKLLADTEWPQEQSEDEDQEQTEDENEVSPEKLLKQAASGASYTDIQQELIEAGLAQAIVRNYLVGTPEALLNAGLLVRTRKELDLLRICAENGMAAFRINAIKGRLQFRRGKKPILFDRGTGDEIQPMDLDQLAEQLKADRREDED